MNQERVEAAAKALHKAIGLRINPFETDNNAVMFSDEAVERAAATSGHKPSVIRAVIAALKGAGDE